MPSCAVSWGRLMVLTATSRCTLEHGRPAAYYSTMRAPDTKGPIEARRKAANPHHAACCIARRVEAAERCPQPATLVLWVKLVSESSSTRETCSRCLFTCMSFYQETVSVRRLTQRRVAMCWRKESRMAHVGVRQLQALNGMSRRRVRRAGLDLIYPTTCAIRSLLQYNFAAVPSPRQRGSDPYPLAQITVLWYVQDQEVDAALFLLEFCWKQVSAGAAGDKQSPSWTERSDGGAQWLFGGALR
ncbi:hypothetical protein M3J07_002350 [Ascochyta lentis]